VPYIYYNAVHEAAHVVVALCYRLDVVAVFVKPGGICTTRTSFDPAKTMPCLIYGMKIAGSIAVDIQNQKEGKSDDDGFGAFEDPESDAAWTARITSYLSGIGITPPQLQDFEQQMRTIIRRMLIEKWSAVEALAHEIARSIAGGAALNAVKIGEIFRTTDPTFYEMIKANLTRS
jgi:hypothetical protein